MENCIDDRLLLARALRAQQNVIGRSMSEHLVPTGDAWGRGADSCRVNSCVITRSCFHSRSPPHWESASGFYLAKWHSNFATRSSQLFSWSAQKGDRQWPSSSFSAWPHFCPRQSRRRCWRRSKNRERRRSTEASVLGPTTTQPRTPLLTPAISVCRWSSAMCAVRRGIDEHDYRDLTGIGGCCARAHRLAYARRGNAAQKPPSHPLPPAWERASYRLWRTLW